MLAPISNIAQALAGAALDALDALAGCTLQDAPLGEARFALSLVERTGFKRTLPPVGDWLLDAGFMMHDYVAGLTWWDDVRAAMTFALGEARSVRGYALDIGATLRRLTRDTLRRSTRYGVDAVAELPARLGDWFGAWLSRAAAAALLTAPKSR